MDRFQLSLVDSHHWFETSVIVATVSDPPLTPPPHTHTRSEVSGATGCPGVHILRLHEIASLICSFYLAVAKHRNCLSRSVSIEIVSADPSLRYTLHVAGTWSKRQTTPNPTLTLLSPCCQLQCWTEYRGRVCCLFFVLICLYGNPMDYRSPHIFWTVCSSSKLF